MRRAVFVLAGVALLLLAPSAPAAGGQAAPDSIEAILDDLDDLDAAWYATARAQEAGPAIVPHLIARVRPLEAVQPSSDQRFSVWSGAYLLALAKMGQPAIPGILDRLRQIGDDVLSTEALGERAQLVQALATNGPSTVPEILDAALRASSPHFRERAFDLVLEMEPRREAFGQYMGPLSFWTPEDGRQDALQRAIAPRLAEIAAAMERDAAARRPGDVLTGLPAAYMLARWGSGAVQARGLAVLRGRARERASTDEPYHRPLDSVRMLHRLQAPGTAALILDLVPMLPPEDALGERLSLAVALHQIGDPNYAPLLRVSLEHPAIQRRREAIDFAGVTGNLALVEPLIALLDDRAETGSRVFEPGPAGGVMRQETIGDLAHAALRRLTMQELGADPQAWRAWRRQQGDASRQEIVSSWIADRVDRIHDVPVEEATRWIAQLAGPYDASMVQLVERYLGHPELGNRSALSRSFGSERPTHVVVDRVFGMMAAGFPGARTLLDRALHVPVPEIREAAATVLAMFDRRTAADHLADLVERREASQSAIEMLLLLEDARGIPPLLEGLDRAVAAGLTLSCSTLRLYTQQPFACDAVAEWQAWWQQNATTFVPKAREAALDEVAFRAHNRFTYSAIRRPMTRALEAPRQ